MNVEMYQYLKIGLFRINQRLSGTMVGQKTGTGKTKAYQYPLSIASGKKGKINTMRFVTQNIVKSCSFDIDGPTEAYNAGIKGPPD